MSDQWVFLVCVHVCVHENLYSHVVKINVKFNKVSCHKLSACLARLTCNVAAWCLCFSAVLERAFQQSWVVWSSCFQALFCFFLYSPFHWSNRCWQVPVMAAHGWVTGICQPWELYSIYELAGHSVSPWIPQAPTFHLSEAVVNDWRANLREMLLSLK